MPRRADRTLTYQARSEGDWADATAYPLSRAELVKIFESLLLRRRVFVRATGRPARHYAGLLEGLGYHPSLAGSLVMLDGEELVRIAAKPEDRAERYATYEFFDALLRATKKDARAAGTLDQRIGTSIDAAICRDEVVRVRARGGAPMVTLLRGLVDRFLRAARAPRVAPLPEGICAKIDELSSSVGLSLAPEGVEVGEHALSLALWRGRIRVSGAEQPPFVGEVNERADLRYDRRAETWQISDAFRSTPCPLGSLGFTREHLLAGLGADDAGRRIEAFERLAVEPRAEDLDRLVAAFDAERDPRVRAAALESFAAFDAGPGGPARDRLAGRLVEDEADEGVRIAAARALAGSTEGAKDERVRGRVEHLLTRTDSAEELDALLELYGRAPPGGRVNFLEGLLDLKPPRLRPAIVEAAGEVGGAAGEDRERALAMLKRLAAAAKRAGAGAGAVRAGGPEEMRDAIQAARRKMREKNEVIGERE